MHGIYTNGHHLSLISAKQSENVALNPITSPWQSPSVMRRRRRRGEKKKMKGKALHSQEGAEVWRFGRRPDRRSVRRARGGVGPGLPVTQRNFEGAGFVSQLLEVYYSEIFPVGDIAASRSGRSLLDQDQHRFFSHFCSKRFPKNHHLSSKISLHTFRGGRLCCW